MYLQIYILTRELWITFNEKAPFKHFMLNVTINLTQVKLLNRQGVAALFISKKKKNTSLAPEDIL